MNQAEKNITLKQFRVNSFESLHFTTKVAINSFLDDNLVLKSTAVKAASL